MLTAQQVQLLEQSAFRSGVMADDLMEKVGFCMARVLLADYPSSGRVIAFLGRGHNAGDALVVLRHLQEEGWHIEVRSACADEELALLTRDKLVCLVLNQPEPVKAGPLILLDGLLGIGATGEIREPLKTLADEMNQLRLKQGARTIAMDLPSGLDPDDGTHGYVVADHTLTVGVPKTGLVTDAAIDFVGRLTLIDIEELPLPEEGDRLITSGSLRPYFPHRSFSCHKRKAGRVAIIAGSPGFMGAAALASEGALRGGAGLITLWTTGSTPTSPEIMMRLRAGDWGEALSLKPDALVIGPGLGMEGAQSLFALLEKTSLPTVLDADALNLIAKYERFDLLTENVVITPHPGEMARLHPVEGMRAEQAKSFVSLYPSALLLKGARTLVTQKSEVIHYNTTGTPGLATGGQGDLLAGVIGALLAQGLTPLHAARAGAWLTGRAAELAQVSEQSLTPSDVAQSLGEAFSSIWK